MRMQTQRTYTAARSVPIMYQNSIRTTAEVEQSSRGTHNTMQAKLYRARMNWLCVVAATAATQNQRSTKYSTTGCLYYIPTYDSWKRKKEKKNICKQKRGEKVPSQ